MITIARCGYREGFSAFLPVTGQGIPPAIGRPPGNFRREIGFSISAFRFSLIFASPSQIARVLKLVDRHV